MPETMNGVWTQVFWLQPHAPHCIIGAAPSKPSAPEGEDSSLHPAHA